MSLKSREIRNRGNSVPYYFALMPHIKMYLKADTMP